MKDVTTGKSREIFQRLTEEPETHVKKERIGGNPELDREVEEWDGAPQSGVRELLRGGIRKRTLPEPSEGGP